MEAAPFMNLAKLVKQMTPVFLVAPTARNGITLIQRLLNTTRQIIVYGENPAFVQTMPSLPSNWVVMPAAPDSEGTAHPWRDAAE